MKLKDERLVVLVASADRRNQRGERGRVKGG